MNEDVSKYADILDYDWNQTSLPERMPLTKRAKIFLPFSALAGYDEELEKTLLSEIDVVV